MDNCVLRYHIRWSVAIEHHGACKAQGTSRSGVRASSQVRITGPPLSQHVLILESGPDRQSIPGRDKGDSIRSYSGDSRALQMAPIPVIICSRPSISRRISAICDISFFFFFGISMQCGQTTDFGDQRIPSIFMSIRFRCCLVFSNAQCGLP